MASTIPGAIAIVVGQLLVSALGTLVLTGLIVSFASAGSATFSHSETKQLAGLNAESSLEGAYSGGILARYGYINGARMLSMLVKEPDGAYRYVSVNAEDALIYEKSEDPVRLEIHYWEWGNPFLFPWVVANSETYTVYLPEGSIVESFTVEP